MEVELAKLLKVSAQAYLGFPNRKEIPEALFPARGAHSTHLQLVLRRSMCFFLLALLAPVFQHRDDLSGTHHQHPGPQFSFPTAYKSEGQCVHLG